MWEQPENPSLACSASLLLADWWVQQFYRRHLTNSALLTAGTEALEPSLLTWLMLAHWLAVKQPESLQQTGQVPLPKTYQPFISYPGKSPFSPIFGKFIW
jgi:hypothetical protein